jgi:hypothetical protein
MFNLDIKFPALTATAFVLCEADLNGNASFSRFVCPAARHVSCTPLLRLFLLFLCFVAGMDLYGIYLIRRTFLSTPVPVHREDEEEQE